MRSSFRSKRKVSGGRYRSFRGKRKYELVGQPALTKLDETKSKKKRVMGGNKKNKLLSTDVVNLVGKDGKVVKTKIKNVVDNPADKHLARRNIMTKGAIVETEQGKAKVTSRPGQDGVINAVLIK